MQIPLNSRKYPGLYAIIDAEDYELVSQYRWHPHWNKYTKTFYAYSSIYKNKKCITLCMHRLILNLTDPKIQCDHINHDTLSNVKSNLRIVTSQQNQMNRRLYKNTSSKYKGVTWHKKAQKWQAQIEINHHYIYLGCFANEIDAAKAYDIAAKKYFKEYALLNEINF